jgi:MtfA peptidase
MIWFIAFAFAAILLLIFVKRKNTSKAPIAFPAAWRIILDEKVLFYHNLAPSEKIRFEHDILRFLKNVRVTGVHTEVDITDKLLVASSAVIPVFGFPDWNYTFLDEVLLYPASFDRNFTMNSREETITGMVGSGSMERKMILSKPSLHRGFDNTGDKQNVGVHEFIHLLDKEDGVIDGIPATLSDKKFALPWLKLIETKTEEMKKGKSDINEYGATQDCEFLAVAGEYFFERPQLLQKNHPELYQLLSKAFNQDTVSTLKITRRVSQEIERNDPCPCGSGLKFKKCCMDNA